MKTDMITVADQIRTKVIKPEQLKNLTEFAKYRNMCLSSIALKDGTAAKILASPDEIDCLIMKNGKVLTAKGSKENPANVMGIAAKIFDHVIKRGRAVNPEKAHNDSNKIISDYFDMFDKETREYFL